MAIVFNSSNGSGGALSSDCSATRQNVMANATAITRDSNDIALQGLLPLAAVKIENGGSLQINSITAFSVSQSNTTPNTVIFSIPVTAQSGRPWGGVYIRCKLGGYPTDRTDGTECGYFSQNGSTFTLPAATDEQTWYFRAWDFYRYNQRGDSTYDSICWGTSHDAYCTVKRYPTRYTLIFPGDVSQNVQGSLSVPIGFTHMDVAVVACGGWSGCSSFYGYMGYSSYPELNRQGGQSGGEGGEVRILSLGCSVGQQMSWNIGKRGTAPHATDHGNPSSYSYGWDYRVDSQGTAGNNTTFSFNGNTYTCAAGRNGVSANRGTYRGGGSGTFGADGGAGSDTYGGSGGNGNDGTLFTPTNTRYGGGGAGCGSRYLYDSPSGSTHDERTPSKGYIGVTDGAYGHGGNGHYGDTPVSGQPGAIIVSFT